MDVTALYEAAAAGTEDTTVQVTGLPETEIHTDPGGFYCAQKYVYPPKMLLRISKIHPINHVDEFII